MNLIRKVMQVKSTTNDHHRSRTDTAVPAELECQVGMVCFWDEHSHLGGHHAEHVTVRENGEEADQLEAELPGFYC